MQQKTTVKAVQQVALCLAWPELRQDDPAERDKLDTCHPDDRLIDRARQRIQQVVHVIYLAVDLYKQLDGDVHLCYSGHLESHIPHGS